MVVIYKEGWEIIPKRNINNVLSEPIFTPKFSYKISRIIAGIVFVKNQEDEYSKFTLPQLDYFFKCPDRTNHIIDLILQ